MSKGNRTRRRDAGALPRPGKCIAHNRFGEPCGKWAMKGQAVCSKHGGKAPQNLKKAEERLLTYSDILMQELLRIATSADSEAIRLSAVRDALDRIGIGTKREVDVTVKPWQHDIEGLIYDAPDKEDVVDAELVEDEPRAIPPSDWEWRQEATDIADHPPRYGRGNRLRGR